MVPEFKVSGEKGAIFGPGRVHRYWLWRSWDKTKKPLVFIGLNPSTADEVKNDPTVERMERRARAMGYGGLIVVNIFAFRATDPMDMIDSAEAGIDVIGRDNDMAIVKAAIASGTIVCGWGSHGTLCERGRIVKNLLIDSFSSGEGVTHLGLTKNGQPKHPLYIGYKTQPQRWWTAS
jgi:hypothetical protein